ncbi:MAG: type I asparaginase [Bacteroidales bacterium]|nr:type I asparaginase [Bacteroidales bacterium]
MDKLRTPHILIIYTGGTIGMIENPETGALENFDFEQFRHYVPELNRFNYHIDALAFDPPIDSSDMEPRYWVKIAHIIADHYASYDGFVLLHGTDTMAYTASALSFMLENLGKPVIITGSQLPIGQLRTDGKENLLTSIEIAAARNGKGEPMVPEVCIFFKSRLMRGNRTTKINAEGFNAFRSYNYPSLAHAGIHLKYDEHLIRRPAPQAPFKPHYLLDNNVLILTLFPGIRQEIVDTMTAVPNIKAIILKTYGSGNAPQKAWLVERIRKIVDKGVIVVNITQCSQGTVEMRRYGTGLQLLQAGVINGYDSTVESMVTKLMFLLGHGYSHEHIKELMQTSIAGEITLTE